MVDFKQRSTIKHTWAKDFGVFYGKGGRMMHHLRSGGDDGTVRRISVCYVSNIRITPNYQQPPGLDLSWYGHNLEQTSMICVHIYNIECILTRSVSGISYKKYLLPPTPIGNTPISSFRSREVACPLHSERSRDLGCLLGILRTAYFQKLSSCVEEEPLPHRSIAQSPCKRQSHWIKPQKKSKCGPHSCM